MRGKLAIGMSAMVLTMVLTGCPKTGPQRPTYRSGRQEVSMVDSTLLQAIETNQHLAEEADRALTMYVDSGFAQQELGYWSRGMVTVDSVLATGSVVTLHRRVYTMDSVLLEDVTEPVTVGQANQIQAVSDALTQMQRGQEVTLIVPWYLAYGSTGTAAVAPYTNVRIELKVE
ncbi:MAG: FKBP-type peptidyl-prolyl cis-trans isomerase [Paludibacteraceae bacterium]|nr:FKBP-type peptidyl-prolyl cis-trans isomerase [Paludibacteraceae bacterium]